MNFSDPFIMRPGRHDAAGDRPVAGRGRRLRVPAGRQPAHRRVPDDPRLGKPARRRPRHHGGDASRRRWSASSARSPASPRSPRSPRSARPTITIQFDLVAQHRQRGARRAGRAQRRADRPAGRPADRCRPSARPIPAAAPVLILALTSTTLPASAHLRRGRHGDRAAHLAGRRRRRGHGQRRRAAGDPRAGRSGAARGDGHLRSTTSAPPSSTPTRQSPLGTLRRTALRPRRSAPTTSFADVCRITATSSSRRANGNVVRLVRRRDRSSAARATAAPAAWFNRKPAVLLIVTKQADANVIETVDRVQALLPELKRLIPAGIEHLGAVRPHRHDPRQRARHPAHAARSAIALVMIVVFVFLRRTTPTLAAGITVPLSLAGTCAAMWVAGFSLDNLSLMALAVSVGFVVDDAIVMIENVFRNMEAGPVADARRASRARARSASRWCRSACR